MREFVCISDIVEKNGKTVRENNLEKRHAIPIGALVEIKFNEWLGNGACRKIHARLWVVRHTRDCDGTPLYSLGQDKSGCGPKDHGFVESQLTVIDITPELLRGENALEWEETT